MITDLKLILVNILELKENKKLNAIIKHNQIVILTILIGLVFVDSIFIKPSSDIVIFGLLFIYLIYAKTIQSKSKMTFYLCLGLLCGIGISFLLSKGSVPTEKLTVWFVLFMVIGIIQQWHE